LDHALGRYVALANNDILMMTPGWDVALINALPEGIGLVSPVFDRVANPAQEFAASQGDADVLFFVMVMGSQETFAEIGPLDEQFGLGNCEDTDYSIRVRAAGGRLVVEPNVEVQHRAHQTFNKILSQEQFAALLEHNKALLAAKWGQSDA
jgi:GT2 family glycosyltransferase